MTSISEVLARGLDRGRERAALAGCAALIVCYAAALGWLQLTADPIDRRFFRQRQAFNIAALQQRPASVGQPLELAQAGQAGAPFALLEGWSAPEPWGVWTDGEAASLAIALPQPLPAALTLAFDAVVSLGVSGRQAVGVSVNGREIARWDLHERQVELAAPIPAEAFGLDGTLRIGFTIAHPDTLPHSKDPRRLGLGLRRIEIRPSSSREREG